MMILWLVCYMHVNLSDWAVQVLTINHAPEFITLTGTQDTHMTLMLPLSTQVYKCLALVNLILGVTL